MVASNISCPDNHRSQGCCHKPHKQSFEFSNNNRPGSEYSPASKSIHRKRKRSVQVATTSSDLPTVLSDSTNATSGRALQSTRQRNPSVKKAQGFQAIKRIVNQRESNPPRHLEKEGFNSSGPLRASLRRNDVSIKLLQNRSRVYNIN